MPRIQRSRCAVVLALIALTAGLTACGGRPPALTDFSERDQQTLSDLEVTLGGWTSAAKDWTQAYGNSQNRSEFLKSSRVPLQTMMRLDGEIAADVKQIEDGDLKSAVGTLARAQRKLVEAMTRVMQAVLHRNTSEARRSDGQLRTADAAYRHAQKQFLKYVKGD